MKNLVLFKMKPFTLYFSLYGKKMKTTVQARSLQDAKDIIRHKIVFHKVTDEFDVVDFLKDLMK